MYYIRHFPWASTAVAAGIGYLLVLKKHVVKPDPEMLAELLHIQQVKVDTSKVEDKQSMIRGLVVMGLTWGLKNGINYAIQQLTTAAVAKAQSARRSSKRNRQIHPRKKPGKHHGKFYAWKSSKSS